MCEDLTLITEKRMDKKMENEIETGITLFSLQEYRSTWMPLFSPLILLPMNFEDIWSPLILRGYVWVLHPGFFGKYPVAGGVARAHKTR